MFTLQQKVNALLIHISFGFTLRANHSDHFRFITGLAADMQIIQRDVIDHSQPPW